MVSIKRRGKFRGGEIKPDLRNKTISIPTKPWYRQDGIKRSIGFVVLGAGSLIGGGIGMILQGVGGLIGTVGIVNAGKKSNSDYNNESGLWYHVTEIMKWLFKFLTKRNK